MDSDNISFRKGQVGGGGGEGKGRNDLSVDLPSLSYHFKHFI